MKRLFKGIIKIIICVILFLVLLTGIDYYRLSNAKAPIFCKPFYNSSKNLQVYKGVFYSASRKVRASSNEPIEESSNISFDIFGFPIPITVKTKDVKSDFIVETKEIANCQEGSKLYYADLKIKVYTYCFDTIQVNQQPLNTLLKKDLSILEDIDSHLDYMGLLKDSTMEFRSNDSNVSNNGLTMYRCQKTNINDVYIGPYNMTYLEDFCTYKDDDFMFLWKVTDETPENLTPVKNEKGEVVPEVVFEDETYRYEFDLPKSNYVFITVPEVRGRMEKKYPFLELLRNQTLTIDQMIERGLNINKVDKNQEIKNKENNSK